MQRPTGIKRRKYTRRNSRHTQTQSKGEKRQEEIWPDGEKDSQTRYATESRDVSSNTGEVHTKGIVIFPFAASVQLAVLYGGTIATCTWLGVSSPLVPPNSISLAAKWTSHLYSKDSFPYLPSGCYVTVIIPMQRRSSHEVICARENAAKLGKTQNKNTCVKQ